MKKQRTLSISITDENMKELERAENFLDTTRRTFYLLNIYLWRNETLTEKELKISLNEIEQNNKKEIYFSSLPSIYTELYKEKQLYLFSLNEFISALFHKKMKNGIDQDRKSLQKVGKKNRIYHIQENILKDFVEFSEKVNINQKTLINYAFMENMHLIENNKYLNKDESRSRKGIEFSLPTIQKIDEVEASNRENVLNKVMYLIPKLL